MRRVAAARAPMGRRRLERARERLRRRCSRSRPRALAKAPAIEELAPYLALTARSNLKRLSPEGRADRLVLARREMPADVKVASETIEGETATLKVSGTKSARLSFLGVKKKFQKTRKYAALNKSTYITSNRDLVDLVGKRLLMREGGGRSTYYNLTIPGWGWYPVQGQFQRDGTAEPSGDPS